MPVGFDGTTFVPKPTYEQESMAQRQIDATKSTSELVTTAFSDQWLLFGAGRALQSFKTFEPDPSFSVPKDREKELSFKYGRDNAKALMSTQSKQEYQHLLSAYDRDIERHNTLAKYGTSGAAMSFAAGIVDPVGWGMSALTEGALGATKIKGIYKAATLVGASAAENMAMESVLYAGDTQKSIDDIYMAGAFGAVIGGSVGVLTRKASPELSSTADNIDTSLRKEATSQLENDAYKAAYETGDIDMSITNHINSIKKDIKPLSKKRTKELEKQLINLNKKIASAKDGVDTSNITARKDAIESKLEMSKSSLDKQKELNDFISMPYEDQVSYIRGKQTTFSPNKLRDSAGAMRFNPELEQFSPYSKSEETSDFLLDLEIEGDKFDHEIATGQRVKPKYIKGLVNSPFAYIMNKGSQSAKGLALRLFENAQGNGYAQRTASILTEFYGNKMRSSMKNRYNDGFTAYIKESGRNYLGAHMDRKFQNDFNKEVYSAITNPKGNYSEAVLNAAQGVRDQLAESLRIRKEAGEAGFEKVTSVDDYIPIIFDSTKLDSIIVNRFNGDVNKLVKLLAKGYVTGKRPLKYSSAEKLAKLQISRMAQHNLTLPQSIRGIVTSTELESMLKQLKEDGVPEDVLSSIRESKELRANEDSISNRAKASMGINTNASIDGVKVMDILNTNVGELVENYTKEAAFGSAIASSGFSTKNELMNAVNTIEMEMRDSLSSNGRTKSGLSESEITKMIKVFDDNIKLLEGHTLDAEPTSIPNVWSRRLRDYTALLRLNKLGLSQLSESANLLSHLGVSAVMKDLRIKDALFGKWSREGGLASGALQDSKLREVESAFGYIQEDEWLYAWNNRHDDFGENPELSKKFGDTMDRFLALGGRLNSVTSGFKAIQGGLDKLAMRGLVVRLQGHLDGTQVLKPNQLKEAGWSDDFMKELKMFYDKNPKWDKNPDGTKVRLMNFNEMTPQMRETLGIGLTRQRGRIIQKNFVGEYSEWMNTSLGKLLSQFKRFSITSLEKQFINGLYGDKAVFATRLALSAGIGYAAHGVKVALNSSDKDKDYIDNQMSGTAGIMGALSEMPQLASLTLMGDALASLGVMPDSIVQNDFGDAGFRPYRNMGDVVPAVGVALDAGSFAKSLSRYVAGDDNISDRQILDKGRRLVPLANTIGVGDGLKAISNLTDD